MKAGLSLKDLMKEVLRQQESKRDYLASTDHVSLMPAEQTKAAWKG